MSAQRLFKIINILLEQKTISATALAKELEVSTRTIYRDIDKLTLANIPVYTTQGREGGVSLLPNYVLQKTLLSNEEQEQILIGLKNVSSVYKEADDLSMKLQALFQNNTMDWLAVDLTYWSNDEEDTLLFETLKEAILNHKSITFDYLGSNQTKTNREVLPAKLVYKTRSWYLQGYCLTRNAYRTFKLSRIKKIKVTTNTFTQPLAPPSIEAFINGHHEKIVLQFDKSIANRVYEEFNERDIEVQKEYLVVSCAMPIDSWLYGYLLSYGSSCKVLKPQELQDYYKKEIKKLNKIYNT